MINYRFNEEIDLPAGPVTLRGDLAIPLEAEAIVVFAHGSGSSRHSPRNQHVARKLQEKHYATLLFDLLTVEENRVYLNRFQVDLLAKRLIEVTKWLNSEILTANMAIGYFGASTGAAAALIAASELPDKVLAVVSRGGRPDMAEDALHQIQASVLLIVGGDDETVIRLNEKAYEKIKAPKEMAIVKGASHLFEEQGKLEEVTDYALGWFGKYLKTEVPL
jgi:putative phosphoribosyl transferase